MVTRAGRLVTGLALAVVVFTPAAGRADDEDSIEYRQHIMKTLGEQAAAIRMIVEHKAPATNFAYSSSCDYRGDGKESLRAQGSRRLGEARGMGTMGRFRKETRYSRGSCRRTCHHGEKRRCLRRRTEARSGARLQELPRATRLPSARRCTAATQRPR